MGRVVAFRNEVQLLQKPWMEESPVPVRTLSFMEVIKYGFPGRYMDKDMRRWKARNINNLFRGLYRITLAKSLHLPVVYGQWCKAIIAPDGHRREYGLVSLRVFTRTGAAFAVDAFQGLVSLSSMRYHGLGSGFTVESIDDTALESEISSAYNPTGNRATGTLAEIDCPTTFRSVANTTVTSTVEVSEVGLFSQASTTGGVMLDRAVITSEVLFSNFVHQTDFRLDWIPGS